MIRILPLTIAERLDFYHQDHLLTGWDELSPAQQATFAAQLESVDFDQLTDLISQQKSHQSSTEETPAQRAYRAKPPSSLVRLPSRRNGRLPSNGVRNCCVLVKSARFWWRADRGLGWATIIPRGCIRWGRFPMLRCFSCSASSFWRGLVGRGNPSRTTS